ncbi:hypothetical protein KCU65_g939, partial [Aureobasidium melanogenum]
MNRMDNLPPKLLCDIIDLAVTTQHFSYKPHLSPYAAVSRRWQRLIESKQFSHIRINSDDVDTFASVFGNDTTGEHRKAALQQLFLHFANQLLELKKLCPALTMLEFVFKSPFPPRKPLTEVPSVLLPYASLDQLCISLRKLCQSMQRVVLTNLPISSQLFWPSEDDDETVEDDEPFWPHLTHFDLEFSICAAEGGLWTDLPPLPCTCRAGPTSTPDEKHRSDRPAHTSQAPSLPWPYEELEELLLVFAKAIARMPLLQNFRARVGKSSWLEFEDQGFGMRYSSPAEGEVGINGAILAKRLEWTAPPEWRMSSTLEEQWRSILGDTGVVEYRA